MAQKNEKTKASVYMNPDEYTELRIEAVHARKADGKHIKISDYLLGLIRLGKKVVSWGFSNYDWPDVQTVLEGGKPDRDWLQKEFENLKEKAGSPHKYQELLLERKQSNDEAKRYLELQREVIEEELEDVEHKLEI